MKRSSTLAALAALVLAAGALAVVAQDLPRDLQRPAGKLPAAQRAMLQARAARLQAMSPAQRADFQQRLATWQARPPAERSRLRAHWQAWQALPADERVTLAAAAARFEALPMDQQIALRERFATIDLEQRKGWLLGPVLGADFATLQPLLGWVPEDERLPLLATLRAMTPQQRSALGVLAQRIPPQQRDALRRGLLATSASNRDAWLRSRLAR